MTDFLETLLGDVPHIWAWPHPMRSVVYSTRSNDIRSFIGVGADVGRDPVVSIETTLTRTTARTTTTIRPVSGKGKLTLQTKNAGDDRLASHSSRRAGIEIRPPFVSIGGVETRTALAYAGRRYRLERPAASEVARNTGKWLLSKVRGDEVEGLAESIDPWSDFEEEPTAFDGYLRGRRHTIVDDDGHELVTWRLWIDRSVACPVPPGLALALGALGTVHNGRTTGEPSSLIDP